MKKENINGNRLLFHALAKTLEGNRRVYSGIQITTGEQETDDLSVHSSFIFIKPGLFRYKLIEIKY